MVLIMIKGFTKLTRILRSPTDKHSFLVGELNAPLIQYHIPNKHQTQKQYLLLLAWPHQQDMTSIISSHHCNWSFGIQENPNTGFNKVLIPGYTSHFSSRGLVLSNGNYHIRCQTDQRCRPIFSSTVDDINPDDSEDQNDEKESSKAQNGGGNNEMVRDNLERLVGTDDSSFSGIDLATLIRNKYGRSYDVQLIKKEFLGRNLLAMNVMWKYREQRSFPLTEEEYLMRLDDVANNLKCWGAVSHIRNSLATVKERPRIGKAVSIFIDMDESGGRANEWIYK